VRKSVLEEGTPMINAASLKDWKGSWRETITGEKVEIDARRVYAVTIWSNMLSQESVFRQWLGCEIDINYLLSFGASDFVRFWQSEVKHENVPRQWIRSVIFGMQGERKVTDGNPTDSAISIHAVDVDLIISADKNFISMVNRIQSEAEFKCARAVLIRGGSEGISELFHLLSGDFFIVRKNLSIH
jgi:hypothetical protein